MPRWTAVGTRGPKSLAESHSSACSVWPFSPALAGALAHHHPLAAVRGGPRCGMWQAIVASFGVILLAVPEAGRRATNEVQQPNAVWRKPCRSTL